MLTPAPVTDFPGLDLRSDSDGPSCSVAVDVDLGRPGRVRRRDATKVWNASPGITSAVISMGIHGNSGRTLSYHDDGRARSVLDDGAVTQSPTTMNTVFDWQTGGTANFSYGLGAMFGQLCIWNGTVFAVSTIPQIGPSIDFTPWNHRLVTQSFASGATGNNRLSFSDPYAPFTFDPNNYVDLSPGDGEAIRAIRAWQNFVFVFKETKFYVFYGEGAGSAGQPVFNFRPVANVKGCTTVNAACAGRDGVYYLGDDGIYLTSGGNPTCISRPLDPLFGKGELPSWFPYGPIIPVNQTTTGNQFLAQAPVLMWADDRLYVAARTTGSRKNILLVWDSLVDKWMVWGIDVGGMTYAIPRANQRGEVVFADSTATSSLFQMYGTGNTDAHSGSGFTGIYRSGFQDFGSLGVEKEIRETELMGSGTVGFAWARDFQTMPSADSIALSSEARPRNRRAVRGQVFSWQLEGSAEWQVRRIVPFMREMRPGGVQTA